MYQFIRAFPTNQYRNVLVLFLCFFELVWTFSEANEVKTEYVRHRCRIGHALGFLLGAFFHLKSFCVAIGAFA